MKLSPTAEKKRDELAVKICEEESYRYHFFKRGFDAGYSTAKLEAEELFKKIPDAMKMEDLARNWSSFAEDRQAQHFYEGMLHMRSYILDALGKYRGET